MDHIIYHSKYTGSVTGYQLIECLGLACLASFYQVQLRYIGLSGVASVCIIGRESGGFIQQPVSGCRSGGATRRDIHP